MRLDERRVGLLVPVDDAERLLARKDRFDTPDDDSLERVPADGAEPGRGGGIAGRRGEAVEVQGIAGKRTDKVGPARLQDRMEGVRMLDVLLGKMLFVGVNADVEPPAGDDAAFVEGVFAGVAEGDKFVILLEVREVKRARPPHGCQGRLEGPRDPLAQGEQLGLGGEPVEAPTALMDGSRPPINHDFVAIFEAEVRWTISGWSWPW
jgi:hypothetical protein